jgi:hypothetical protein
MTGGSTSTPRNVAHSKKKAELKTALAATKRADLRSREKSLGRTGVLGLLDPHVAHEVEMDVASRAPMHDAAVGVDSGYASDAVDVAAGKKQRKKVSISFAPSSDADGPFAAESDLASFRAAPHALHALHLAEGDEDMDDDDATVASAALQYEVAQMSNAYINSEISNANKRSSMALPSAAKPGVIEALGEADSPTGIRGRRTSYAAKALLLGHEAEDVPQELASTAKASPGALARYSDVAFDYNKRPSPDKKSGGGGGGSPSPLRLSAVRDLAGMIEKIRVSTDHS